jgi:hypothetical protein
VLPTFPEPAKCCVLAGTSAVLFALLMLVSGCGGSASESSAASANPAPPAVSVAVSPTAATVQAGSGTQSFNATVQNDSQNKGVSWALSGAGCSSATCGALSAASSASGVAITYTAPASVPNPASVTLTATSVADGTKSAAAAITVSAAPPSPLAVTVSPTTATVQAGVGTQSFSATVQNDAQNKGVTWALSGAGCSGATCGALSAASSASGVAITYTAPPSVPNPASVTLTATSVADGTKSAAAVITVTAASGNISVTISPKRGGLTVSQSLNFTATVANDSSGVTWSSTGGGSFSSQTTTSAVYVAPAVAGVIAVTATSNADVTKSASATIGVTGLAGVTTYRYDLSRDGVNANEYALTTSNVTTATFGKLFACPVDGSLFAQPLWVANLPIGGGTHNVIFAASSHDTVYAFDADASPCVTYWSKSLLGTGETWLNGPSDTGIDEIYPDVGIVGTPVIDPATKILYVVAKSKTTGSSTTYHQRIHALSLIDGSEQASGPVDLTSTLITIAGSGQGGNGTTVAFDPLRQNQRPGLALVNGNVYVGWGSHGDLFMWHGWLVGFNKSNLASAPIIYNTTRNGRQGSIWMAGGAPAADSNNNLYVITGNGDWDGVTDFGDSFLKLSTSGGLSVADWFTPYNQASLDAVDSDLGSGGAVVLVDLLSSAPFPHLVIGGGKGDDGSTLHGRLYVLNRDSLGHNTSDDHQVVQEFSIGTSTYGSIYGTPAFWQNTLYFAGSNGPLNAFALNPATSTFNTTPSSKSATTFGYPSSSPAVSATGASNGIVWSLDIGGFVNASKSGQPTVVHAYDATNLSKELWNSGMVSADTPAGVAVKFTVPTVANGKVYVGSSQELDVFGLKPN